jgi:hypothetical protein
MSNSKQLQAMMRCAVTCPRSPAPWRPPYRSACGERAEHNVRRLGAGAGSAGALPGITGSRCACGHRFSRHATLPCKEVRVFETSPALVVIIVATLLLLDYRFHSYLIYQPFGLTYR